MAAVFTLLTISIGEEFEFKFFKILACVSIDQSCNKLGMFALTD